MGLGLPRVRGLEMQLASTAQPLSRGAGVLCPMGCALTRGVQAEAGRPALRASEEGTAARGGDCTGNHILLLVHYRPSRG